MRIPAAIEEMVVRYFGSSALPDYSRTPELLTREPYNAVREQLSTLSPVVDLTDINRDLGFVYVLDRPNGPTVRLSVVGPFAVVTDEDGAVVPPEDVSTLLVAEGFQLLDERTLELPVRLWSGFERPLYEFVFEFDEGFPWDR